ncbi:ABC transporter permease [Undibacter mobilis]|uniref:MlaE family lipid ABC transporter permease subunit n=1 Tax=Undibacter mobilis TaxID=2292256 RepID=A0A371BCS9_9BRAD|nr:MlaE family lipid ABC transporter permease subunit [Undibacter mobilis]RDV05151.1 MlaE family lipid ABC transporter permease subunit [Undibacter mobilis]
MKGDPFLQESLQGDRLALTGSGIWTAAHARALDAQISDLARRHRAVKAVSIDMAQVEHLDTFGAWLLEKLVRGAEANGAKTEVAGLKDDYRAMIDEMHQVDLDPLRKRGAANSFVYALSSVGENITSVGRSLIAILNMFGALITAILRVLPRPRSFRMTSLVHQLDMVAWRAVPIILLITFLIGCIIAQQGLFHFRKFGADVYVVDMVGILVLRELGVLIVCIMVAGRSGSAYTAELGSMKMREEIDALKTMGFDPTEVLILPRILALVIGVPILTFIGSMAALYGGGLVCWLYGGIAPDIFLSRLKEAIALNTFQVGMIKAPFMALVIGVVSCVEGLAVKGSAESLGRQTTASVVEAIFLVIVMDGLFAIFFASIGM